MNLDNPIFQDANAAREHLEAMQWPNGPVCPHCGNVDGERITTMKGKAHRPGLYNCMECRKQFSVTVGTVFERSKIALNKWLLATFLVASSKKGMSAHQLHRMLGVTYKTAWFMAHRIREAMKEDVSSSGPIGGEGKTIEADETYIGKREDQAMPAYREGKPYKSKKLGTKKQTVFALVERGGRVRSFHVPSATKEGLREILFTNAPRTSTLYTDESRFYTETGKEYAGHETVNHSAKEYARGIVHTNTIENVFSVFKRGMTGVYQHCAEKHLHRYLAEFDFRYNRRTALKISDQERHDMLLAAIRGKRLTYRRIGEAANA
ncbi:IS1595 family transposase [Pelagibacterium flavum]|uniref:IS1595 family transposase n=1 Tax=Pelagibacterium flavum TaxID=2984530 RepID=A0ABY6IQW2_9HYPH|nr:IS1595 family transposase [Pelagibacterium sp. YIM 151497]UYQ71610.1 IS1595 family transposase [Pelagibacterium sp. YIM 151497]